MLLFTILGSTVDPSFITFYRGFVPAAADLDLTLLLGGCSKTLVGMCMSCFAPTMGELGSVSMSSSYSCARSMLGARAGSPRPSSCSEC